MNSSTDRPVDVRLRNRVAGIRTLPRWIVKYAGTLLIVVCAGAGLMPAVADTPTTVRIARDRALPDDLVTWFAAPSTPPSARRPLPHSDRDNPALLEVPARYDQPGAQVKILDVRTGLIAHVPIRDSAGRLAANLLGPNLLQNPDFQRDVDSWVPELNGGQAKGQLEWLGAGEVPRGVPGKAARIRVLAIDAVNWHVQLHQVGLNLIDMEPYTLTFWARADRSRPLSLNATLDRDDFHWIGLSNQVALTTEWRKFSLVFTATRTLPNHNRLGFVLGDAVGTVDIAAISLQRGASGGPVGANIVLNSGFMRAADAWTASVVIPARATTKAPSEVPAPAGVAGKVAHVDVTETGMQSWYVQFFQIGLDLSEGKPYTLSFWAKSNHDRPLSIIAGEDKDDFHTVGLDNTASLDTEWRKFVFVFTATRTVRNSNKLTFLMGSAVGEVDLAGVTLQPGAEAVVSRSSRIDAALSPSDFRYSEAVKVLVTYMGRQVQDIAVTVRLRDENLGSYKIQATDHGSALFGDVPVDEKLTVTVSDGAQTAEFPRIVASDAPQSIDEIQIPESWTQIKTSSSAAHAPFPIIGRWQTPKSDSAQQYVTTFNADGTGTIKPLADTSSPDGPVQAPATGAFLWHVKRGKNTIVMGTREYVWSISGSGSSEKLVLRDAKGSVHTLYRR